MSSDTEAKSNDLMTDHSQTTAAVKSNTDLPKSLLYGYSIAEGENLRGKVLLVTPIGYMQGTPAYHLTPPLDLPEGLLESPGWARLPFSVVVGFAIRTVRSHSDDGNANVLVESLCLETAHQSPGFGLNRPFGATGGMMVTREDGKDLHVMQLIALVRYAKVVQGEIGKAGCKGNEGGEETRKDIVDKWVNKDAFKKFFEELKKVGVAEEPQAWAGVECLV